MTCIRTQDRHRFHTPGETYQIQVVAVGTDEHATEYAAAALSVTTKSENKDDNNGGNDNKERETRAFVKLNNFIPDSKCILITNSEEATLNCDGIEIDVVPVWKWLLEGEGKRK